MLWRIFTLWDTMQDGVIIQSQIPSLPSEDQARGAGEEGLTGYVTKT